MKYMLLIHQGDTPTPQSEDWERLSEDEQKAVYVAYRALNETPGVSPGVQMQPRRDRGAPGGGALIEEVFRGEWPGRRFLARRLDEAS